MSNTTVPTRDQLDERGQVIFDAIKQKLGVVPNLYATIGYSSGVLESFLGFADAAASGAFTAREVEAIKLAVSEANGCDYCRAAHTALAKMNGFTQEETLELRDGTIADPKLNVLTNLAIEVAETAGQVDEGIRQRFFDLGYDEKALIDFAAIVISVTFTNYVFGLTHVPIDFPKAESLEALAV